MFLIIDAMHLASRARFVHKELEFNGMKTGAIYGFKNSLLKLQRDFPKHEIIIAWDTRPTKRKDIYPAYKSDRVKDESYFQFLEQVEIIKKINSHQNIKQFYADGYEADDIMFSICCNNKDDDEIILLTGDMDWAAMVSDKVRMLKTPKHEWVDQEYVKKYYQGLESPKYIQMFKSLTGDSDNIKGISRIRKKLVSSLCNKYKGNLDDFIKNFENDDLIPDKWKDKIHENIDLIELNYKVVGLMKVENIILIDRENNKEELEKIYVQLGFKEALEDILDDRIN